MWKFDEDIMFQTCNNICLMRGLFAAKGMDKIEFYVDNIEELLYVMFLYVMPCFYMFSHREQWWTKSFLYLFLKSSMLWFYIWTLLFSRNFWYFEDFIIEVITSSIFFLYFKTFKTFKINQSNMDMSKLIYYLLLTEMM